MEESRVSEPLPYCVETEIKTERRSWSSAASEGPTAVSKKEAVSNAGAWETTPGNRRHSEATESDNVIADRGFAEEKCCRLEAGEAFAPTFSSEASETPRSSEYNTGATAGDSTAPSCSDGEVEADILTDQELQVDAAGEKYCRLQVEETYSPAFSSETSDCQTGATAGDSTFPSCSDIEADIDTAADSELSILEKTFSRLEVEQALSLAVFSETCDSLSRGRESHKEAGAARKTTVPSLSDVEDYVGPRQPQEPYEGWATDPSTMSSEMEEGMWKEVRHGKRRPLQAMKPSAKRLPRVALVALFDAVDAFISESGSATAGAANGSRALARGPGSFSASRRGAPGSKATGHPLEEAPTEAEAWASKRLQATLDAIASRLENVERCVLSYHSGAPEVSQEAMDEQRLLLQEVERKMAGVLSLRAADQRPRRPLLQSKVELLVRRLLRLRDVLQSAGDGGGGFTELDVQVALKGARRHLKTAQGAAARLSQLLVADGEG